MFLVRKWMAERANRKGWLALAVAAATLGPWGELPAQPEDPRSLATAYRERGFRYLEDGSPQAALGQFFAAVEADPTDMRSHLAIGMVQAEHGRLADAIDHFESALAIDPDFAQAHFHRALALDRTGQADAAIDSYHEALRSAPDLVPARYMLSAALRKTG